MNKALKKAIEKIGGQTKLANALTKETRRSIVQSHIHSWLTRNKKGTPAEFCIAIEKLTEIPKEELRPDVYGRPNA